MLRFPFFLFLCLSDIWILKGEEWIHSHKASHAPRFHNALLARQECANLFVNWEKEKEENDKKFSRILQSLY